MQIYQIKIALRGITPEIWRRILIPSDLLLENFHQIIQTTMGWTNSHLHQFKKGRKEYSVKYAEDDTWEELGHIDYKSKKLRISKLLIKENDKISYEYDYGDSWWHDIILEKILPLDDKTKYPICLSGKMNCPPEDCGGIWGYAEMVEILKQPDHEEYKSYLEWLGEVYDPKYFDIDDVNLALAMEDYGCLEY